MKSDPDGGGWNLRALVGSAYGRWFYQRRHSASGGVDDGQRKMPFRLQRKNQNEREREKERRRERVRKGENEAKGNSLVLCNRSFQLYPFSNSEISEIPLENVTPSISSSILIHALQRNRPLYIILYIYLFIRV